MSASLKIRPYHADDEEVVMALWRAASQRAHHFIIGEGEGERARMMREVYLIQAQNWVAERDGRVIGLLGMLGAEIGGLFVDPSAQRSGAGRAMVAFAAARHEVLTLEVYARNESARAFYERLGFVAQSERVDERTGEVLILMRLETALQAELPSVL